jgi:hypothetical protein
MKKQGRSSSVHVRSRRERPEGLLAAMLHFGRLGLQQSVYDWTFSKGCDRTSVSGLTTALNETNPVFVQNGQKTIILNVVICVYIWPALTFTSFARLLLFDRPFRRRKDV